ncbi:unnamed protein product [Rotaria magnacalcarata]|uniref:P/Homo B domain-containing protein n=3 Tax=Rotaria magnacalcarata TaxID=392030 RepID=A0A816N378_9BILA|nr:unnamed protein product [Rotaria magnacalcarata]
MLMNVFKRKIIRLVFLYILLVNTLNVNASRQVKYDDDDEIMDIGVRLTNENHDSLIADLIAEEKEVLNAGLIDGINLYHFHIRRKRNHRSKRSTDDTIEDLKQDERVEFVTVGTPLERQKREFLADDELIDRLHQYKKKTFNRKSFSYDEINGTNLKMSFDDKLYSKQWYLENEGQLNTPPNHDINMAPAWLAGYSGKNVTICIVDDGLDHPHPELADRYQPQYSYDLNDLNDPKHDPLPRTYDSENSHGTRCAGAASGKANNELCGVGVAFNSYISGIRLLDGRITTLLEARALTLFAENIHIKSASWGPTDDGTKMEAPGSLVRGALDYSVTSGRYGKGTIFVWASGNGGGVDDDCGADGYVSHQNVISIGSINHLGETPYFSEYCPSTMAVAYTGGRHSKSAEETVLPIGIVAADVGGKCTTSFFGTSGAAPVAAGAFALVLEANPELGYRDVMHIVARTARIPSLTQTNGWIINGAGFHVSDRFGFGVIDVAQMIALSQNWTNVQQRYECYHEYQGGSRPLRIGKTLELSIDVKICENITSIEHVIANISYSFHRRGDVKITIISPSQTPSEVLSYRDADFTDEGIKHFPFMSLHHWGESPTGSWKLRIETRQPQTEEARQSAFDYGDKGQLGHFGLLIYGSNSPDQMNSNGETMQSPKLAFAPTQDEIKVMYKRELAVRQSPNIIQKRNYQNLLKEGKFQKPIDNTNPENDSIFELFRKRFGF